MRQVVVGAQTVVRDVPPAPLGPDELRLEIAYAGICGSELHAFAGSEPLPDGELTGFGHEYSAVVRETGADVDRFAEGDLVVCLPRWACQRCPECHAGRSAFCRDFRMPARGAWADEMVVPARVAFQAPRGVSPLDAALTEPLACALRGVERARAPHGHVALVIGGGPIGLLTAVLALRTGAAAVLVSEPRAARRELAEALGATAVDPAAEAVADVVAAATGGRGADVVYEAVGSAELVTAAADLVAPRGTVVVLGVAPEGALAPIAPRALFDRELTITGAFGPEAAFGRALRLLPAVRPGRIVTHELGLDQIDEALAIALSGECGKVLLAPNRDSVIKISTSVFR